MQSLGDKIRINAGWLIGATMVTRILKFGVSIILARLLLPADFGLIVTMSVFTGIAGYFAGGGMGDALVRAPDLKESDYAVVFTVQMLFCVAIFAFFYFIAPAFARWFDEPIYEPLLRVSALTFLIRPFLNVPSSRLTREMRFRDLSLVKFVTLIASSAVSVYLAWRGYGPWALLLGGLAGAIVTIPLMNWSARWWPRIFYDVESMRTLGSMGIKFSANHILSYLKNETGNLIIAKFMGPAPVGIYNRADSLASVPRTVVIKSAYGSLFRGFAEIQGDRNNSRYMFLRSITLFSLYTMPLYVVLWWIADPLIPFVYGANWAPVIEPLRIITVTGLLLIGNPSGAMIAAHGQLGREFLINLETFAVLIVACIVGTQFGIPGIAIAVSLTRLYTNLRLYHLASSCVGADLRQLARALGIPYLLSGVLFLALWGADYVFTMVLPVNHAILYLAGMLACAALVYAAMFFVLPFKSLKSEAERWKRVLVKLPVVRKIAK